MGDKGARGIVLPYMPGSGAESGSGYLHSKFTDAPITPCVRAKDFEVQYPIPAPSTAANSIFGCRPDGIYGASMSCWFRTNGDMDDETGYSDPYAFFIQSANGLGLQMSVQLRCNTGDYAHIRVGNYKVTKEFTAAEFGNLLWFGPDGITPQHGTWYFMNVVCQTFYASNARTKLRLTLADESGNWHSTYYNESTSLNNYTMFNRAQNIGVGAYYPGDQPQYRHFNGDFCQMRVHWRENEGVNGTGVYTGDFYDNQIYKRVFDQTTEEANFADSNWVTRAYWPLDTDGTVQITPNSDWDFLIGDDGEIVESGGPALEAA